MRIKDDGYTAPLVSIGRHFAQVTDANEVVASSEVLALMLYPLVSLSILQVKRTDTTAYCLGDAVES